MPEITDVKKLVEHYKLMYNRTTPYEMGTRNYTNNEKETVSHPEENVGWTEYRTLRAQIDAPVVVEEVIPEE